MRIQYIVLSLLLTFAATMSGMACNSSSTSQSVTTDDTDNNTVSGSELIIPSDLVISSITASSTSDTPSNIRTLTTPSKNLTGDPEGDDYLSKKTALESLIGGDGECRFTIDTVAPTEPTCYAPRVDYTNHPGGGSGQLPNGDVGIWSEYEGDVETGEACAAAQANYLIDAVASRVDNMISLMGAISCAGNKGDLALPEAGAAPTDLLELISTYVSVTGLTITEATLARLEDDASGNAQYRTEVNATITNDDESTSDIEIYLIHIPLDETNSTYRGKMSVAFHGDDEGFNCTAHSSLDGSTEAGTILYEKSSDTDLTYEMNYASFCGRTTEPFDDNNNIDATNKLADDNQSGWGDSYNYGLFSLNPNDGTGTIEYAWQAGPDDNATRALNVNIETTDDNSTTGDAYFGFGPDVTDEDVGLIQGFVCNWAGPDQSNGVGHVDPLPFVQYQALTREANGTVFASDSESAALTYAPTNNCNSGGEGFTYDGVGGDFSNDNLAGDAVTHNLANFSLYEADFTPLTPPEDL